MPLLDVSDPSNNAAVQSALDAVGSVDPEHEPFVRRVLDQCSDSVLGGQARVLLAAFEQARGRNSEAAALYRLGLPQIWGSGTRAEANALVNYALVCLVQRRSFEGLALLRRACEFAEERARTLVELEDWTRLKPMLAKINALLPELEAQPRAYVEMVAVTTQIEAAFRMSDAAAAESALERLPELAFDDDRRALPFHLAIVHATLGRTAEALEQIAVVRGLPPGPERYTASTLEVEIHCRLASTPADQLRQPIEALLDILEGAQEEEGAEEHSAGDRLVMAGRLARMLDESGGAGDLAQRALRIAAGGVIERIAELERFLRALPQLCFAGPEEQSILDDHRERFLARHEEILDLVHTMLDAAPGDATQFETADGADPLWVCVCAWCRLLRGPDGLWLPVRKLEVPTGAVRVTHGICQRCREKTLSQMRSVR